MEELDNVNATAKVISLSLSLSLSITLPQFVHSSLLGKFLTKAAPKSYGLASLVISILLVRAVTHSHTHGGLSLNFFLVIQACFHSRAVKLGLIYLFELI